MKKEKLIEMLQNTPGLEEDRYGNFKFVGIGGANHRIKLLKQIYKVEVQITSPDSGKKTWNKVSSASIAQATEETVSEVINHYKPVVEENEAMTDKKKDKKKKKNKKSDRTADIDMSGMEEAGIGDGDTDTPEAPAEDKKKDKKKGKGKKGAAPKWKPGFVREPSGDDVKPIRKSAIGGRVVMACVDGNTIEDVAKATGLKVDQVKFQLRNLARNNGIGFKIDKKGALIIIGDPEMKEASTAKSKKADDTDTTEAPAKSKKKDKKKKGKKNKKSKE